MLLVYTLDLTNNTYLQIIRTRFHAHYVLKQLGIDNNLYYERAAAQEPRARQVSHRYSSHCNLRHEVK